MKDWKKMWFALCTNGTLVCLGEHDNYDMADETAYGLGYEAVWLVSGDEATQWAELINAKKEDVT